MLRRSATWCIGRLLQRTIAPLCSYPQADRHYNSETRRRVIRYVQIPESCQTCELGRLTADLFVWADSDSVVTIKMMIMTIATRIVDPMGFRGPGNNLTNNNMKFNSLRQLLSVRLGEGVLGPSISLFVACLRHRQGWQWPQVKMYGFMLLHAE